MFSDNSISAYNASKTRPGYNSLVKAYESGTFDALVCYELDRLTRQPRQLEDWIDAAEGKGLALVTLNGEADLETDSGRMFARIKLSVARNEMERKSARQKRAAVQRAQLGRPPKGRRLLGYTTKDKTDAVVKRNFALFDSGEALNGIRRTLDEEGVPTRYGGPWTMTSVRNILMNPRYAGRAIYHGEVVEGVTVTWEPLVSEELFDLVQAKITDPARRSRRVGTERRHLGSGLYLCDYCVGPVTTCDRGRLPVQGGICSPLSQPDRRVRARRAFGAPEPGRRRRSARADRVGVGPGPASGKGGEGARSAGPNRHRV